MNTFEKLTATAAFLKTYIKEEVRTGIVLGSGLGNFIGEIEVVAEIPYQQIPNFPVSTVEGHHGKLIYGKVNGRPIIAMAGRFHFYEGYSSEEVVFPIRV